MDSFQINRKKRPVFDRRFLRFMVQVNFLGNKNRIFFHKLDKTMSYFKINYKSMGMIYKNTLFVAIVTSPRGVKICLADISVAVAKNPKIKRFSEREDDELFHQQITLCS